jgi:hypothetical protein
MYSKPVTYAAFIFNARLHPRVITSQEFDKLTSTSKEALVRLQFYLLALNGQWIMSSVDLENSVHLIRNKFGFPGNRSLSAVAVVERYRQYIKSSTPNYNLLRAETSDYKDGVFLVSYK